MADDKESFTSIASTPVSPSMSSVPPNPNKRVDANHIDIQVKPVGGEKSSAAAESPLTAMEDLATNRSGPGTSHEIRGISIPKKPDPPGPEGEFSEGKTIASRL